MSNLSRRSSLVNVLLLLVVGLIVTTRSERLGHSAPFTVNPHRFDPYKNSKFRVKWDGHVIPGIAYVSPLRRSTEVVEHREGGDFNNVRKSPGITKFDPIMIRRGVTHDTEFERWADKVWSQGHDVSLKDFRKDIIIEILNEAGQVVLAYKVYRCWVSKYEAVAELNADANSVAIETIELQHEGWERDKEVTEPVEPSFDTSK